MPLCRCASHCFERACFVRRGTAHQRSSHSQYITPICFVHCASWDSLHTTATQQPFPRHHANLLWWGCFPGAAAPMSCWNSTQHLVSIHSVPQLWRGCLAGAAAPVGPWQTQHPDWHVARPAMNIMQHVSGVASYAVVHWFSWLAGSALTPKSGT